MIVAVYQMRNSIDETFFFHIQASKGMMRTMIGNNTAIADIVPIDICVNMMIAVAWSTGIKQ